jgi:enterochelin esterase-like enzyme
MMSCAPRTTTRLEYGRIDSEAMGREMDYGLYLPPRWDRREPLPLVVFLHGGGDDHRTLERHGAPEIFDRWIAAGKLRPFVMVVPNGEMGFWTNWYDGTRRYEDYVVDDIISKVRSAYPIAEGRENLHLMGVSMGGAGTIRIGLNHRDRFGSLAVISAPLYRDEQVKTKLDGFLWRVVLRAERVFGPPEPKRMAQNSLYQRLRRPDDLAGVDLLFGAGDGDSEMIRQTNADYHRYLKSKGVPHRYLVYSGEHSWYDWNKVFPDVLCHHLSGDIGCRHQASGIAWIRRF